MCCAEIKAPAFGILALKVKSQTPSPGKSNAGNQRISNSAERVREHSAEQQDRSFDKTDPSPQLPPSSTKVAQPKSSAAVLYKANAAELEGDTRPLKRRLEAEPGTESRCLRY